MGYQLHQIINLTSGSDIGKASCPVHLENHRDSQRPVETETGKHCWSASFILDRLRSLRIGSEAPEYLKSEQNKTYFILLEQLVPHTTHFGFPPRRKSKVVCDLGSHLSLIHI